MIMLGNLSADQMEKRLGIEFTTEEKETLNATRQLAVNETPLADECWHCFDIPFMVMCGTKATCCKVMDILKPHVPQMHGQIQVSYERE